MMILVKYTSANAIAVLDEMFSSGVIIVIHYV